MKQVSIGGLKRLFKKLGVRIWTGLNWLRISLGQCRCEHSTKTSGCIRGRECLHQVGNTCFCRTPFHGVSSCTEHTYLSAPSDADISYVAIGSNSKSQKECFKLPTDKVTRISRKPWERSHPITLSSVCRLTPTSSLEQTE
jgi:hypothetical protein